MYDTIRAYFWNFHSAHWDLTHSCAIEADAVAAANAAAAAAADDDAMHTCQSAPTSLDVL